MYCNTSVTIDAVKQLRQNIHQTNKTVLLTSSTPSIFQVFSYCLMPSDSHLKIQKTLNFSSSVHSSGHFYAPQLLKKLTQNSYHISPVDSPSNRSNFPVQYLGYKKHFNSVQFSGHNCFLYIKRCPFFGAYFLSSFHRITIVHYS